MPEPRSAEEWAQNIVVDQIHEQAKCECEYFDDTLTKMCAHHKFQVIAIGNALRAYTAQETAALQQELAMWQDAHRAECPTIADDEGDAVLDDFQRCTCLSLLVERDALQRRVETLETVCAGAKYDLQAVLRYFGGLTTSSQRVAFETRVIQLEAALRRGKMG